MLVMMTLYSHVMHLLIHMTMMLCVSACASVCMNATDKQAGLVASSSTVTGMSDYILDSGATSHYINNIEVLQDVITLSQPKSVTVANNEKVKITRWHKVTW